ncbi:MAG: ferrous iron transport protein A [Candidatus Omnitrophica bacterium]|nr:ferrous iron transport protein A [Candidatus Omnitrophota bacterium]
MSTLYLTELDTDKTATIRSIEGGIGAAARLESMGIRAGVRITKISAHFWKGPVTVLVGKSKVAIGHGMAQKIVVEVCSI